MGTSSYKEESQISNTHRGNTIPAITQEEHAHISGVGLKKVAVIDNAGNQITTFGSSTVAVNSLVTLGASPNFIGIVTVVGNLGNSGNVTLNPSPNQIGSVTISHPVNSLATVTQVGLSTVIPASNVTLNPSPNYIGLATVDIGSNNNVAVKGNLTLSDPKGYIGLVTNTNAQAWPDPKTFIGLATVNVGSSATVFAVVDIAIGDQVAISSNITLNPSPNLIGIVTVGNQPDVTVKGNLTIDSGNISLKGNLTLSDSKGFIGLVTVGNRVDLQSNVTLNASSNFIGLVTVANTLITNNVGNITVEQGDDPWNVAVKGNVTLSDSKGFIGLTTTIIGSSPSVQSFGQFLPSPQSIASGGLGPILLDQFGRVQAVNVGNLTIDSGNISIKGNLTLSDSKTFIGLVTLGGGIANLRGNLTLDAGSLTGIVGTVTIQDGGNSITVDASDLDIRDLASATDSVSIKSGNVTVQAVDLDIRDLSASQDNVAIKGNLTLSDPKGFIGLVTITGAALDIRSLNSTATIFAVVNTSAQGQSSIVLDTGANFIGIVTVANKDRNITGNLTLSDSKGFIGLVTVGGISTLTLADPKGYIGLVSIGGGIISVRGNLTLDAGSQVGIVGNVTLSDPKTFIGLTTTVIGSSPSVQAFGQFLPSPQSIASGGLGPVLLDQFGRVQTTLTGTVTIQDGGNAITVDASNLDIRDLTSASDSVAIGSGNVTVQAVDLDIRDLTSASDSVAIKSGNVTVQAVDFDIRDLSAAQDNIAIKGNLTLSDAKTFIGLVTIGGISTVTLSDPKGYIGLVSVAQPLSTTFSGNITLDDGSLTGIVGNVTISDSKTYIGLTTTTLGLGDRYIGLVTATQVGLVTTVNVGLQTLAPSPSFIGLVTVGGIGTVTLADPKGFIGLVTIIPTYLSTYTSFSTVISALATIVVPPSGKRIILKDVFVSSLGRTEMSVWAARSDATVSMIPPTGLATTGGYVSNFGDSGLRWSAVDDGLTVRSGSTIGVFVNLRFE